MSLEPFGTFLTLRIEPVLDIGFAVKEIVCRHLDIFGIDVVCLYEIYVPYFHCSHLSRLAQRDRICCSILGSPAQELYTLSNR